jgi:hypothetical protein
MEAEIAQLKLELKSAGKDIGSMKLDAADNRALRSDLTPNEQIALQKEMAQLDRMLKGYMEENKKHSKFIAIQKDLEEKLKGAAA